MEATLFGETLDHRFPVQRISRADWVTTTGANAAADYRCGHGAAVLPFLGARPEPEFRRLQASLPQLSGSELTELVGATRSSSLLFLVMMLTGACNANCTICFTDRRRKAGETEPALRDAVLRQARELGARFVYVPGEGEPTIDRGFWEFLDGCKRYGLEAVVFTNGISLSDDRTARRYFGLDADAAVERLLGYPVSFYVKYWSADPELVGEMMEIDASVYRFTQFDGQPVPAGLVRLLERFPRERVGIEVVIERRNAEEVAERIVPFARAHELSRIVEMIQHNGRVLDSRRFDVTPAQARLAAPLLSPTSCAMAPCKAVVTSRGMLSPRIAVLEQQIPGVPVHVGSGELFDLLHETEYLANLRYDVVNCLCEQLPNSLSRSNAGGASCARNVTPSWMEESLEASHPVGERCSSCDCGRDG
jgi:hypothetical protein